jgi:CHAT domain-containing protein
VRFGDAQEATRLYEGALAIYRRARPQDESSAQVEYNLAELHFNHGDLQSAAHAARQGLLDAERANPEGELAAILLDILAQTESARGDHETARRMLERSVGLLRRAPRDTILFWEVRLAETLSSLGNVSSRMEDWAAAEAQHREAATILAAYPGHSVLHAVKMARVAELLARRGELAEAQALLHEALRVCSEQDSDGLSAAGMLRQLGDVSLAQGNLHEAAEFFQRSLEIRSRLVPGTEYEAQSLHGVGLVHRRSARLADAAAFFARAVDALEAQKDRVGGSEDAKARFADRYSDYYRDVIEALIALDRPAEAFGFLERHRTRALQVMLAQREVGERDIPPDIERDRRALNAEYDRLERLLADAAAGDERERLLVSLARLRSERQALYERLRRASPSYVAARYTVPLDLEQARAALDPGTLLLAFSVGQDSTSLFVVQPKDEPALRVHDLAVTAQELRQQVLSFRQLAARSQASRTEFDSLARGLFELLLGPASVQISRARRLLIIPDGPLFFLPFAALRQDGRYLAELWPIHYTPSATLYGQLKRGRPAQRLRQTRLVAFGDPAYPQRLSANEWVRSAARRGLSLDPLPGTRREVQEIAALFGRRATVYLGAAAREERAKALGLDADYIHFACHGWVDDLLPYDSGLVLAAPHPSGHENGILQAWEVMEQVRIQAELVTLSACDSGLGQETRGEGVIGLARAFHYAGARSVVSSLWAVSDDSTRRLMTRFYKSLAAGRSKDEALQIAQREMIRSRRSRPFHWAAFQLSGDWR